MRSIFNIAYHSKEGKFGKIEQHYERKFNDYIKDIMMYAHGFMMPVEKFTKKKNGIVDTEKIKETVAAIISEGEGFKDEGEKKFYSSFLYCALALLSVRYDFVPNEEKPGLNAYTFPDSFPLIGNMDMRLLVGEAEITADGETLGLEYDSLFAMHFPELYYLLSGKYIELKTVYIDYFDLMTEKELADMNADREEGMAEIEEADLEADEEWAEYEENFEAMSEEEMYEANMASGNRIKAVYPGYKDYLSNLEVFAGMFEKYADTSFFTKIKNMVSDFLAAGGYTIFNNEEAYINMMVSVNRARKTMSLAMQGKKRKE